MGVFHHRPLGFQRVNLLCPLVKGLAFPALYHVAEVDGVGKQGFQNLRVPGNAMILFCFDLSRFVEVCGWRESSGVIEPPGDLYDSDALRPPREDLPDSRRGFLVDAPPAAHIPIPGRR